MNYKNYKNKTLRIYHSKNNSSFVKLSNNSYWRVYHYIENGVTYDESDDENIFYNAGIAIGNFQNLLSSFDSNQLFDVIKDFHNTPKRYNDFIRIINKSNTDIISSCIDDINFFIKNKNIAKILKNPLK